MKNKTDFKRIISFLLVLTLVFLSSCNSNSDDVVFSFEGKEISKNLYKAFYDKNKISISSMYKEYYAYLSASPEKFMELFGFLPDGSETYWDNEFWNEVLPEYGMTAGEYLDKSTIRACKEYLVYEKIAKDYNYSGLPETITSEIENIKKQNISTYGSYEAWDVATVLQYGITAEELIDLSRVSSYGTVLPVFIFNDEEKNKAELNISDKDALDALSESVQFKFSVFNYSENVLVEDFSREEISESEAANESSSNDSDLSTNETSVSVGDAEVESPSTDEERKEYYISLMKTYYMEVSEGKVDFNEIYKKSHEYNVWEQNSPNGVVFTKKDFNSFFKIEADSFKVDDLYYAETDTGVYLIKIVDFSSDIIQAKKESMIDNKKEEIQNKIHSDFSSLVDRYIKDIGVNEDILKSLTPYTKE